MSEPKKDDTADNRYFDHGQHGGQFADAFRNLHLNKLRIDPYRKDSALAAVVCDVIAKEASEDERAEVAEWLLGALEDCSADEAESFFSRLVTLKRNWESHPQRNGYAYLAYCMYIDEAGKEPSKAALKKYIIARKERFKDQPGAGDGKGWTRLWDDSGLSHLPMR